VIVECNSNDRTLYFRSEARLSRKPTENHHGLSERITLQTSVDSSINNETEAVIIEKATQIDQQTEEQIIRKKDEEKMTAASQSRITQTKPTQNSKNSKRTKS
jgi:hypothetical protein